MDCKSNGLSFSDVTQLGQLPLWSQLPSGQQKASSKASFLKLQVTSSCDLTTWPGVLCVFFLNLFAAIRGSRESLGLLVLRIQSKTLSIPMFQISQYKQTEPKFKILISQIGWWVFLEVKWVFDSQLHTAWIGSARACYSSIKRMHRLKIPGCSGFQIQILGSISFLIKELRLRKVSLELLILLHSSMFHLIKIFEKKP